MSIASPLRLRLILPTLLLALLLPAAAPTPAAATESCTDTPTPGYIARVCLISPETGAPLGGTVDISARVEIVSATVPAPNVSKVIFRYRDDYLLSDHDAPFDMRWQTTRLVDGTGSFEIRARLSDDVVALHTVPLTLANGVTTVPATFKTFDVRRGTTPAPGARFRVAAVGDAADGSDREEAVASSIASWSPNLMLYLGDVYERGSAFEFDNWYANPAGIGRFRDITNPTVGNHEYLTPGAAGYFDHWGNVPRYYSVDVAGWHIATIDSSDDFGQLRPGTAQYDWLAADLAANRSHCTLVYMHHPRYAVAEGGGRAGLSKVWSLLADRRVTLAVAGHAHHYERWQPLNSSGGLDPRGVTQLVAGAGGHELTPPVLSDSRLASAVTEVGAMRLDLGPEDAGFGYVSVTGEMRDGGTIGCKSSGDTLPPTTPSGLLATPTSTSTAQLSWQPSTDQFSSVAGYRLRRNGAVVATLGADSTTYTETSLASAKTYSWTVDAFDTSDNYSEQSSPAATTMPGSTVRQISSRKLLRSLKVRKETSKGFRRSKFRTWVDADGDRCNTRSEVLLAEAKKPPTLLPPCRLTGGRWYSRYDGVGTNKRSAVGIEHLVPLQEVWQSGARRWRASSRKAFANDLSYQPTLNVATKRVLRARGTSEPQRWLPPRKSTRCSYEAQWVAVKWRWRLALDKAERKFLVKSLRRCGWPEVEKPARPSIKRR